MSDTPQESAPMYPIEENQRLSKSLIWQLQRNFFSQQGIKAWSKNTVPHHITSNRFIAQSYAQVVFGWLRDIAHDIDRSHPVYLVELGAGSGRLAYHFLGAFFEILESSALRDIQVVYVLTDFSESTLEFWKQHDQLKPLFEAGRLDMALFDAESDDTLQLMHRGKTLSHETLVNPLGVIANYFFDGLRQDVFRFEAGKIKESLITLKAPDPEPNLDDPLLMPQLAFDYEHRETSADYYDDLLFNQILAYYGETMTQTHIAFPVEPLGCLKRLLHLSNERLFMLTADKGHHQEANLLFKGEPALAMHGSFSMMMNYHAMNKYTELRGGQFLTTPHRHTSLAICVALFGDASPEYVETRQAYQLAIVQRSPDDFSAMKIPIQKHYADFNMKEIIALLRFWGWDSGVFNDCFPVILKNIQEDLSPEIREELYWLAKEVWKNYYHIGEPNDLAFALGGLMYGLSFYRESIDFLKHSLRLKGEDASALSNIAACYYELHQLPEALEYAERALAINPQFESARAIRVRIQSELSRGR